MYTAKINKPVNFNSFSNILDDLFNKGFNEFTGTQYSLSKPEVNIIESENDYKIEMAAPGLAKDDFEVMINKNQMTIKVSQEKSTEDKGQDPNYKRREFNYSSFTRSFHLPESINKDAIDAKYNDGILTLTLSKKEEAKQKSPRTIKIS